MIWLDLYNHYLVSRRIPVFQGDLVWFDVGNGQEPGRVVEVSNGTRNTVSVMQTNIVNGNQVRRRSPVCQFRFFEVLVL